MDIKLNLINKSNEANNQKIVIFQKNTALKPNEAIAWKVINAGGKDTRHSFDFPLGVTISTSDNRGHNTPQRRAEIGQEYVVTQGGTGDELKHVGPAPSTQIVQIRNKRQQGLISANVLRDGSLVARGKSLAPEQIAVFAFVPTIWIGAVANAVEGEELDSAVIAEINTELSLFGISSADIVMTGGGDSGAPLNFELDNITMA